MKLPYQSTVASAVRSFPLASLLTSVIGSFLIMGGTTHAQILNPISVTLSGANVGDAIYGPVPGDSTATATVDGGADLGSFHYVEKGYYASDPTYGLPSTGTIVSASNTLAKVATFQFQGSNSNNILKFDGTLTLGTPAAYSNLAFLVNALNGSAPETFTLNFSSGPSTNLTLAAAVPYWVGGTPTGGSIALTTATLDSGSNGNPGGENGTPINFYEYDFALSSADSARTLDSISVGAQGDYLVTYAVSGALAVPEPSAYALMLGGLAFLGWWGRLKGASLRA